jgi:chitodextrinase
MSACSSSTQNPQYAQGSYSPAPSSVRPSAGPAGRPAVSVTPDSGGATSAVPQIKANWTTFFSPATPASKRVQLLQNGSAFESSVRAFASSPLAAAVTSKIDSVTLSAVTQAKVKYDLSSGKATVASGATGTSVLQDGTWKVGDEVFCGLLNQARKQGLSVTVPAACGSS